MLAADIEQVIENDVKRQYKQSILPFTFPVYGYSSTEINRGLGNNVISSSDHEQGAMCL